MQLLDRPTLSSSPTPRTIVEDVAAQPISGANQKKYARLKMSLRLNLRRQIFLAVCDDLELRNQLVANLQAELAPRFVSLNLNLNDPNPMAQVTQWLAQRGTAGQNGQPTPETGFQILGVEHLTRQPAPVQGRFLTHLQAIEYYLPALECTMLLWLSRPWWRSVRRSAPTFWDWHTALFEFEGDPTPIRSLSTAALPTQSGSMPWLTTAIANSNHPITPPPANSYHIRPLLSQPTDQVIIPVELDDAAILRRFPEEPVWNILTQEPDSAALQESLPPLAGLPGEALLLEQLPVDQERPLPPGMEFLRGLILEAIALDSSQSHHHTALQQIQQIEQLHRQGAKDGTLAAAYFALGRGYRESIEQGELAASTLAIAIAAHQNTLAWLDGNPALAADVANDLGNLYWMQARSAVEADFQLASLEQAIQSYQFALTRSDPEENPQTYAMIQNNLGSAYGDLAQYQDPAENLQQSVQAYQTALQYRSLQDDPARYAATQNNLGTACWNLAQHQQPVLHLKQAIAAYQAALQFYTPEQEPMAYAMIQNNLGTTCWNLSQCIKPVPSSQRTASENPETLLKYAIVAYHNALAYRTLEAAPAAFAATQNNLGTAYWDWANLSSTPPMQQEHYVQQAIAAYEGAITAVEMLAAQSDRRPPLSFDVFATYNNLALSYYQLATNRHTNLTSSQRQAYLETALEHHLHALQGWEPLSDFHQLTLGYVIQTLRAFYHEGGIQGQNIGLSKIPANLLPEIITKL
jgi:tetratricopeptide (TPR) repeat protein